MALMERVSTLLRANLNHLIDRSEEPDKMVKQLILDMENQLLQVKTQVAIGIADLHLLERKREENREKKAEWVRKAGLAVAKGQDDLARVALQRSLEFGKLADSFEEQISDQRVQVENLKTAFAKLDGKLAEARAKQEVLLARHRRSKLAGAHPAAPGSSGGNSAWERWNDKVLRNEAGQTADSTDSALSGESVEDRLKALERHDEIERLLNDLKAKHSK